MTDMKLEDKIYIVWKYIHYNAVCNAEILFKTTAEYKSQQAAAK